MIIIPLQWDKHSGPDAVGQHKFVFSADESVDIDMNLIRAKKGTQFIVMMIEAGSDEADNFRSETYEETKERFRKHMNSLINSIADLKHVPATEYREEYKNILKDKKLIITSTSELDLQGYALVITELKKIKYELENK